jgi:uncharacterized phage infection (PIP) family protein YhgE
MVRDYRGHLQVMHAGLIDGFRAHLTLLPRDGYAFAILAVREGTRMNLALSDALTDLARALKPVADDLHVLFRPLSTQAVDTATGPHRPMANISTAVQRLDEALKGFNAIIADPNNQQNIAVMVKNFKTVSERGITLSDNLINLSEQLKKTAGTTDDKINKIASGLIENTDKLSQLFDKLNGVAEKISTGQGTFAKMLNDPEFYDALTDTAKRLQLAADDLRQLLLQWQDKGLKIQGGLLGK